MQIEGGLQHTQEFLPPSDTHHVEIPSIVASDSRNQYSDSEEVMPPTTLHQNEMACGPPVLLCRTDSNSSQESWDDLTASYTEAELREPLLSA